MNIIRNLALCITLCLSTLVTTTPAAAQSKTDADKSLDEGVAAHKAGRFKKALILFAKACDDGDAKGCTNLGNMFYEGQGGAADAVLARRVYAKACDGGNAKGCNNLGSLLSKGEGGAADAVQARTLYAKACDGGYAGGCSNLARMVESGMGNGGVGNSVQARMYFSRARPLFAKACDGGDANSCYRYGLMLQIGRGGAVEWERGRTYLRQACTLGEKEACKF